MESVLAVFTFLRGDSVSVCMLGSARLVWVLKLVGAGSSSSVCAALRASSFLDERPYVIIGRDMAAAAVVVVARREEELARFDPGLLRFSRTASHRWRPVTVAGITVHKERM